ncbi:MAG TPA: efflux RND transporter periplasmic adaptor subunit [Chthoniobacterales bacterium]|nr:efflux RND transporter periplasmic adaptor subunit [Chthoniobacterales bacterium]
MLSNEPNKTMAELETADVRVPPGKTGSSSQRGAPRRRMIVLVAFFCAGLAVLILSGIRSRIEAEKGLEKKVESSAVPLVAVIHPDAASRAQEIELPGTTQAFTEAPIYARTSGYLKQWYFDIGAHVKRGQLLAEIETPELDQQLQQAESNLNSAQANLQLAEVTANRWVFLLKTNVISKQETDQAVSDYNAKKATAEAVDANVRRLRRLQEFERVSAPFDGVITARDTDIGALIQNGDSTGQKELFRLAAIDVLRVYISVPEVYATAVKSGETVTLTLDAFPGETFTGTIVRNSNSIDLTSRTLNVEVDVDNPTGRLLPGAYAFVHLKLPANAGSVTIPTNALLFRAEGLRVAVVRNAKVKLVPITIGHDYGNAVEVTSNLTPNDAVIADPSDSIMDSSRVEILGSSQGRVTATKTP